MSFADKLATGLWDDDPAVKNFGKNSLLSQLLWVRDKSITQGTPACVSAFAENCAAPQVASILFKTSFPITSSYPGMNSIRIPSLLLSFFPYLRYLCSPPGMKSSPTPTTRSPPRPLDPSLNQRTTLLFYKVLLGPCAVQVLSVLFPNCSTGCERLRFLSSYNELHKLNSLACTEQVLHFQLEVPSFTPGSERFSCYTSYDTSDT